MQPKPPTRGRAPFTFDIGPRVLLGAGLVFLLVAILARVQGSAIDVLAAAIGVLFVLVGLAAAYSPRK